MRFVDTNILLYSVSRAPEEAEKRKRAEAILNSRDLVLSAQVLQEFYVQAVRASRKDPLTHAQATGLIESWMRFPIQEITADVVLAALKTKERWQTSYWDAAIIEAARAAGCQEVLSEDLNHGQDYGGVRVTNPFL
jgi:predicted nucleic acid-binding protein